MQLGRKIQNLKYRCSGDSSLGDRNISLQYKYIAILLKKDYMRNIQLSPIKHIYRYIMYRVLSIF